MVSDGFHLILVCGLELTQEYLAMAKRQFKALVKAKAEFAVRDQCEAEMLMASSNGAITFDQSCMTLVYLNASTVALVRPTF